MKKLLTFILTAILLLPEIFASDFSVEQIMAKYDENSIKIQEIQNDYGLPSVEVPLEDGFVICTEYDDINEPYGDSPLDY